MSEPVDQEPKHRVVSRLWLILVWAILLVIGGWIWRGVLAARESGRWAWCNNVCKQIGIALHNYHEAHRKFPPAYLADPQGQPMHSWRVLLLPMIEENDKYRRYKFDEPWNSPHNLTLAHRLAPERGPKDYSCLSDWRAGKDDTSDVLIVGPGTAFDGPHAISMKAITDGLAHTLIGGEISESGIHWMEPRDLDVREMSFKINDKQQLGLRSNHPGGANAVFADGGGRFLSDDIDPEVLKLLTTIAGGEPIDRNTWDTIERRH